MLRNTFFTQTDSDENIAVDTVEIADYKDSPAETESLELPLDLIQTAGHLIVRCPIAGAGIHDIDISLNSDTLTIHKRSDIEDPKKIIRWHYQECFWGELTRTIDLPKPVDADHTRASLENGILVITMPIVSRANTRTIKVQS
jgi:HSP20 family protein